MALIKCEECGKEVSNKAPACLNCGAPIGSHAAASARTSTPEEITFYTDHNGIRITNARAIIENQTYSMANLTTVTVGLTVPPKGAQVFLGLIGGVGAIWAGSAGNPAGVMFGLLLIGVAVWRYVAVKDIYHVRIGSAGGESNALSSCDAQYVRVVARALNEAIARRG